MTGRTPSAWRAAMRSGRRFWFPAMAILLAGCASARVSGGAYINETKRFTARLPSDAWRVEAGKSPDLLLRHRSRQAGMSIHATCGRVPASRSVEVVGRHLFFGIERKDVLEQERWPTAGGEGLELVVRGELDGREFLLHSYTLKDPGCVYDLVLFADSEDYAAVNQDFEAFVHGFRRLPERQ